MHKVETAGNDAFLLHRNDQVRDHGDIETAWIGPLDFTQNQLAKFKQLEALALKPSIPHAAKKTFRWGVKEVSPLHRPNNSFHQDRTTSTPEAHIETPPPKIPTSQEHGWKVVMETLPEISATHEDHWNVYLTNNTPHGTREEQEIHLTPIKEALAQFKLLEDLSRPPPNPVLARSQQKNAMSATTKPYHDIIHVAYSVSATAKN